MDKEPSVYISLLGAFLTLLSAFGIALTQGQVQAIMMLAAALIPIVIGIITRRNVYSPASVQKALNMPQGSSIKLLDRALAADVPISPGDSRIEVVNKVETAETEKDVK